MPLADPVVSWRFDVVDDNGALLGTAHPVMEQAPQITHDTGRDVMRTLTGLRLPPSETAAIDVVSDRVRPVMIRGDGSEAALGVFLFTDRSVARGSYGQQLDGSLSDRGLLLRQPAEKGYGFGWGQDIRGALLRVLADAGIDDPVVASGAASVAEDTVTWPAGTARSAVVNALADLAGLTRPWFDGDGRCRIGVTPDDLNAGPPPLLRYEAGRNVYAASIVESDDLLATPNRYVVVDRGNNAAPVVGVWDVPSDAPYSAARRGFPVVEVVTMQGLASSREAQRVARQVGARRAVYEQVVFQSPPDPRHGAFDVVDYLGERWLETGWQITARAGEGMSHTIRKVYT